MEKVIEYGIYGICKIGFEMHYKTNSNGNLLKSNELLIVNYFFVILNLKTMCLYAIYNNLSGTFAISLSWTCEDVFNYVTFADGVETRKIQQS